MTRKKRLIYPPAPKTNREFKNNFIKILEDNMGIVSPACRKAGISKTLYYEWIRDDKEFAAQALEVTESTGDVVENALFNKIKEGDTTAIIFYCKCKLRHRGYNERAARQKIDIPSLVTIQDVEKANDTLIQKLANAEVAEENVIPLQKLIMERRTILETVDLDRRIKELEQRSRA